MTMKTHKSGSTMGRKRLAKLPPEERERVTKVIKKLLSSPAKPTPK